MGRKTPIVVRRPAAVFDVMDIADYLASRGGVAVADRFTASAEKTFERLARMPGMGSRWGSDRPNLAEVRFFPVAKFPNHIIFYRPIPGGIEVLRVLHGARDLKSILEPPEEEDIS
jgi:toxin ParE1/3/4